MLYVFQYSSENDGVDTFNSRFRCFNLPLYFREIIAMNALFLTTDIFLKLAFIFINVINKSLYLSMQSVSFRIVFSCILSVKKLSFSFFPVLKKGIITQMYKVNCLRNCPNVSIVIFLFLTNFQLNLFSNLFLNSFVFLLA